MNNLWKEFFICMYNYKYIYAYISYFFIFIKKETPVSKKV